MHTKLIKISKRKYDRLINLATLLHNANVTVSHFHSDLEREMRKAAHSDIALPMFLDSAAYINAINRHFTTNH